MDAFFCPLGYCIFCYLVLIMPVIEASATPVLITAEVGLWSSATIYCGVASFSASAWSR
jgi:hypothetical protein